MKDLAIFCFATGAAWGFARFLADLVQVVIWLSKKIWWRTDQ